MAGWIVDGFVHCGGVFGVSGIGYFIELGGTMSSDVIDDANDLAAQLTDAYITHQRAQNVRLRYIGECHNCGEPTPEGVNFCDTDCRDDYQRRTDAHRRNGK